MKKIFLSLSVIFLFSCGQGNKEFSNQNYKPQTGWQTLNEQEYSIQYPTYWELEKEGKMNTSFILYAPLEDENDIFRENINMLSQNKEGARINLDDFIDASLKEIKEQIPGVEIKENQRIKNANPQFQKTVFLGEQSGYLLMYEQFIWLTKNHVYILTYTAQESKFKEYQETAESIMNSFIIKKL